MLTTLLLEPESEFTVSELAARAQTSIPTATREVVRAERGGLVKTRNLGRSKLVRADATSYLYEPLRDLLLRTFGPIAVVASEFSGIAGIRHLYIFGSWAARSAGQEGLFPRDIDLLIVGTPDRDEVDDASMRAEKRLHLPVQTTIRSITQWRGSDGDPFLREVKSRPLQEVVLAGGSDSR